ncbi:MAG: bifunctional 4-hydroxy-2-oxoglutarate aldolase/2-dehydro-3-deoxy-phosphogluconate aldolase [Anaerolineae bacterium]|nr:bifunctional 4-hydroxy-2-oxoglutarate aldolase/2-dehydro-3-deoxy-phosphogluconate aldolase [Anaerolineae bacterium]
MTTQNTLSTLLQSGIVAIMRATRPDPLLAAADALLAGGVQAIEVTLTTPGAMGIITQAVERYTGQPLVFGAGSVLDAESARAAILAGAQFIVCPTLSLRTIEMCKRYSIPVMPGAFTPSEVLTAWEAGADVVKLFPADFGGPAYLKAIKAPLPQVRLAPVGGVSVENTADFIRAGADAVGVGGSLISQDLLDAGRFDEITARARRFRQAVQQARGEPTP